MIFRWIFACQHPSGSYCDNKHVISGQKPSTVQRFGERKKNETVFMRFLERWITEFAGVPPKNSINREIREYA